MARNYVTNTTSLWHDDEFTGLTPQQQALYLMLKGQREITAAGTLPLTVQRWTKTGRGWTRELINEELEVLAREGHVAIDRDTEEVLLVKFVKFDGGYRNEKRRPVINEMARAIISPKLRQILADELDALDALPDTASWLRGNSQPDRASDNPSDKESRSDRVVVTEGELVATTPTPQPATLDPVAERPAPKRGTRLDPTWKPSEETRDWTLERLPQATAAVELEKFRNHWIAKSGRDAAKLDWDRTWRNWVLTAQARSPNSAVARAQQETNDMFDRAAKRMGVTA